MISGTDEPCCRKNAVLPLTRLSMWRLMTRTGPAMEFRIFHARLPSFIPACKRILDREDLRINVLEEPDDLAPVDPGECLDDIVLGGGEVVEDGEVADPEVVVLEVRAGSWRTSSGRLRPGS